MDPWSSKEAEMAQLAADEFDVEQHQIRVHMSTPEYKQQVRQSQEMLRNAGAIELAPSEEGYDYVGAMQKGYTPEPDEQGNIVLPNEFYQPGQNYSSGYDLSTGEKVMDSPADVASEARRRSFLADRNREMNFLEWSGCVLAEGKDCPVEGAMEILQGAGRVVGGAGLSFFEGMRELTELTSGGVLDLPDIAQVPDMGVWEGTGAAMVEFLSGYGLIGKGLEATGAAAKLAPLAAETIKNAAAAFAMNPSQGNLVSFAHASGWLDDEDLQYLNAEQLAEEGNQLGARAAMTATDTLVGGTITGMGIGAAKAFRKLQAFYGSLAKANEDLLDLIDIAADRMIERGVERQRAGISVINSGINPNAALGAVEEAAGKAAKGSAGAAQRAADTFNAVADQANGYIAKGADQESFILAQAQAGVPVEMAREAWESVVSDRSKNAEAGMKILGDLL